jgi:dynein heavy chain
MSSIGSEKYRWIFKKAKLAQDKRSILADMILATAVLSYLGPFDGKFRQKIIKEKWMKFIKNIKLSTLTTFFLKILLATRKKRDWIIKGLPNERASIENMIFYE